MKIRITNDGAEKDINEIYTLLKDYNLSHREPSENVPLGIYYEKLGFKEVFALKNYPYTEARYYYTKEL